MHEGSGHDFEGRTQREPDADLPGALGDREIGNDTVDSNNAEDQRHGAGNRSRTSVKEARAMERS